MKLSSRTNKKWRKQHPMIHRSFAIKRGRDNKEFEKEIKEYSTNVKDENKKLNITSRHDY